MSTETAPNTDQQDPNDEARMTFLEHLSELRFRLRNAALIFLVAVIGSFFLCKQYFMVLTRPAQAAYRAALKVEPTFHFQDPTEPFWVYTKLAMYGALLVASPFVIWELWKFVAPGLYKKEKRLAMLITAATALCFIGGSIFGFKVLLTPALTYLFSFTETLPANIPVQIEATITMDHVVGFTLGMLLGTGLAFELPVVLAALGSMGIITARQLWRFNRYALILCTLAGGVLTPSPDVLSQLLMSGPLFGLYNVSIVIVWLMERANRKRLQALEKESGADLVASGD